MRRIARLFLVSSCLVVAVVAASARPSRAAPPGAAPPAVTPKGALPQPSLGAPHRIVGARRVGGDPYVTGGLSLEVEVANTSATALSTTLLVGEKGALARVPVSVAPNARAWVGFTDGAG